MAAEPRADVSAMSQDKLNGELKREIMRDTQKYNVDLIRALLSAGADPADPLPEPFVFYDLTALNYVARGKNRCRQDDEDTLRLLLSFGADPNSEDDGCTLLHDACSRGNIRCASALVELGADVSARDRNRNTPIFFAAEMDGRIVPILLRAGAEASPKSEDLLTPLHEAARGPKVYSSAVEWLLRYGADPLAEDIGGFTPLDMFYYDLLYDAPHYRKHELPSDARKYDYEKRWRLLRAAELCARLLRTSLQRRCWLAATRGGVDPREIDALLPPVVIRQNRIWERANKRWIDLTLDAPPNLVELVVANIEKESREKRQRSQ